MSRRTGHLACGLAAFALAGCGGGEAAEHPAHAPTDGDLTDEVVIDLVDGTSLDWLRARLGEVDPGLAAAVRWNSDHSADEALAVVQVTGDLRARLLAALQGAAQVEAAEPNLRFTIEPMSLLMAPGGGDLWPEDDQPKPADAYPNDPWAAKQWHMQMVGARDAWRWADGEGVIVAVIDTGVAHEDKKGLWAPDLARTRFVPGWDFVNDDAVAADDHGHGTHCAGTIAQSTDNGRGVMGLAPKAKVMPLKVLSAQGWGTTSDIADAIRFAADQGAHVLSLSLGGGGHSRVLASAVAYARAKGCLVVCAAGNGGRARVEYPAAYPGATAVSSVGPEGKLAYYSSHGKQTFIAAPGGDKSYGVEGGVLQNTLDPRTRGKTVYAWWQGTSMATPHVAGAAALLYASGVTRPDGVEEILRATVQAPADAKAGERTEKYGWGVLDAGAAVRRAILLPGLVGLALVAPLALLFARKGGKALPPVGLALGALVGCGATALLAPLGVGEVPLVGRFLIRSPADWDLLLLGPSWHWTPLFACALLPGVFALACVPVRPLRGLGVGLALGWAARLATGVVLPWTDVRFIPGYGALDALWLGGNAVALVLWAAAVVRLGRGRDGVAA